MKHADLPELSPNQIDRFHQKVLVQPCGCWEWQGQINENGYGTFLIGSRKNGTRATRLAHRIAYWLNRSEQPGQLHVCRSCDNRKCVNPAHLWLGSDLANMQDCSKKGRMNHRGESNGGAKLSIEQVRAIRNSCDSTKVIMREYKICDQAVYDIRNRKLWRHVA